ncbi:MAG TPA: hypothetical protein VFP06_16605 [Acidimicrobiales bacterium]|nr:hypothetical protein [Acidimicrobiales bacterium]
MPQPLAGVEPSPATGEAAWLVDSLHPFGQGDTGSVVPSGFEAYARIEHDPGPPDRDPHEGGLDVAAVRALADHLVPATATPDDCWFCLWVGYGSVAGRAAGRPDEPGVAAWVRWRWYQARRPADTWYVVGSRSGWRAWVHKWLALWRLRRRGRRWSRRIRAVTRRCGIVTTPEREYLLFRGPVVAAASAAVPAPWPLWGGSTLDLDDGALDGPNLWWPADRAWVVASEIDLTWTYLGGSRAIVDAVVGDRRFTARRVELSEPIAGGAAGPRLE